MKTLKGWNQCVRLSGLLLLFTGGLIAWCPFAGAGGEIGTGRYIDYINPLLGFSTVYPRAWRQLEVGSLVSFVEEVRSNEPSVVSVSTERLESIQTLDELRRYLEFFRGDEIWEPLLIDSKPGFVSRNQAFSVAYILREPGVVSQIRSVARAGSAVAEGDVGTIIQSLRFFQSWE